MVLANYDFFMSIQVIIDMVLVYFIWRTNSRERTIVVNTAQDNSNNATEWKVETSFCDCDSSLKEAVLGVATMGKSININRDVMGKTIVSRKKVYRAFKLLEKEQLLKKTGMNYWVPSPEFVQFARRMREDQRKPQKTPVN